MRFAAAAAVLETSGVLPFATEVSLMGTISCDKLTPLLIMATGVCGALLNHMTYSPFPAFLLHTE
jgi:putative effector of murein hydrolase